MIAASEPVEFIPRGRQAVNEHPGPLASKQSSLNPSTEPMLLYRLQNVNISSNENSTRNEFWCVREIFQENYTNEKNDNTTTNNGRFVVNAVVNLEQELYVKGHTAVWTKGISEGTAKHHLPLTCFTCDTQIKYAFFCPSEFFSDETPTSHLSKKTIELKKHAKTDNEIGICLIDATTIRIYSPSGEDFRTSLEFPISNVWQTKFGLLLERNELKKMIEHEIISMPRLFSISHALNELRPILIKSNSGIVNLLNENGYHVVFTNEENEFVMLYDDQMNRHFLARLRPATDDEKQVIGATMEPKDTMMSTFNRTDSIEMSNLADGRQMNKTKFTNSYLMQSQIVSSPGRSQMNSPYDRLQSTFGQAEQTETATNKENQVKPSKPIIPEYCLDYLWTENIANRDQPEIASRGFMHVDLVGQTYICYLLPRSCCLMLTRIEKSNSSETPIFGMLTSIPAVDAVCLDRLKLIVILLPSGSLAVYSGPHLISKILIGGILANLQPILTTAAQSNSSFPRRSSLLPTVKHTDTSFDEELHMLSPVYPVQTHYNTRKSDNICSSLRDPAGNRVTLVYPNENMYRIAIPFISECPFVTRCLSVLRQVLSKELTILLISKWYSVRNTSGSRDLTADKEWLCFKSILLQLIGRSNKDQSSGNVSSPSMADEPNKRRKTDNINGSDADYEFMLGHIHKFSKNIVNNQQNNDTTTKNDPSAPLFSNIPIIFHAFHLLYEEMKIDSEITSKRILMGEFLNQLAHDLNLSSYKLHYFLDFPQFINAKGISKFTESELIKMYNKKLLQTNVPNVYETIEEWIDQDKKNVHLYPFIPNVNQMSKNIIDLTTLIITKINLSGTYQSTTATTTPTTNQKMTINKESLQSNAMDDSQPCTIFNKLIELKMTRQDINRLPTAIHLLIANDLEKYRDNPPIDCVPETYELLLRLDIFSNTITDTERISISQNNNFKNENSLSPNVQQSNTNPNDFDSLLITLNSDGMAHTNTKLLRLRFLNDLRVEEVRRLLTSANPVIIDITQKIGVSDHDFIEEKEKQLLSICTRTTALPLGRGMFTLRTNTPTATESLTIPKLCLSGKEKDKGATIELQQIELAANLNLWPLFHNGVAAGLQLSTDCKDIDSTWIVYNKPERMSDASMEHAGFLMALGLNDHLKSFSFMSIYDYLVKCDEITSVGLILGIAASNRGTMDATTTRLLSVHIEALLPATALELDIPQNIQIAAIMGMGILYQASAKRHIAEILLQEIGRPPGPEMENCVERESYALTAGLALGLVTLGTGESAPGLKDLQLPDTLHYYMIGGNRRPLTGAQKEKYKLQSFQVREGDTVNIDITAPGATLALGLMFFKTGNKAVASWMDPPDTVYLLDLVRPDLLLLRMIARGLILWDEVLPSHKWINSQFPDALHTNLKQGPENLDNPNFDHEALCQAYCNIMAGAAFCVGLRYAGTSHEKASKVLQKCFSTLYTNMNGMYIGEYAGKFTVESCLMLILLAWSLVNAGSGDLNILRVCRMLRNRLGQTNSHVTYGSHIAIHMAIGFQFLGAGRFTLSRSPEAIAALVCALFPKFPTHTNDNRYHLQAFRHLYVLAIEPRILVPRDIDSGKLCLCNISYVTIDDEVVNKMAPCMLPELNQLKSLSFEDNNYWTQKFEKGKNFHQLERLLNKCSCVDIKQKAGCVSHVEDPTNLRSFFAQTLTTEQYNCWKTHTIHLMTFSKDGKIKNFINKFMINENDDEIESEDELKTIQIFTLQFYHCLIKDTLHAICIFVDLLTSLRRISNSPHQSDIRQLRLIHLILKRNGKDILLSSEYLNPLIQQAEQILDTQIDKHKENLMKYLCSPNTDFLKGNTNSLEMLRNIVAVIIYYNLPQSIFGALTDQKINALQLNRLGMFIELKKSNLSMKTIQTIVRISNLLNE